MHFKEENIRRTNAFLEKLKPLAAGKNATLSQVVIQWTLHQPDICALVGASNVQQAGQNAAAAHVTLSAEEVTFINMELAELELIP